MAVVRGRHGGHRDGWRVQNPSPDYDEKKKGSKVEIPVDADTNFKFIPVVESLLLVLSEEILNAWRDEKISNS